MSGMVSMVLRLIREPVNERLRLFAVCDILRLSKMPYAAKIPSDMERAK